MNIPGFTVPNPHAMVLQHNAAPNLQVKSSALTGDVISVKAVQPVEKTETLQTNSTESIRNSVDTLDFVRPEVLEKGSAFLADPSWPPMNAVNAIASIIIHDFFLNQQEG